MLGKAFLTGITLFRAGLFPTTLPGGRTAYPGFSSDVQEGVYYINPKDLSKEKGGFALCISKYL